MRELAPTIRACGLPREPFLRLIEANRMDQRTAEYESWGDLRVYTKHSADPVGRLVLGVVGRADDGQLVGWSDDVCTGLQLVNFLQDVPRDLVLGRIYLPAEERRRFGVTTLDAPNAELRRCLAFEAGRARGLLGSGERLRAAIGGRVGTGIGVFARGGLAALDALEDAGWDIFSRRPAPISLQAHPGRHHCARAMTSVEQAYAEVERLTRARARNFAYGIMLLPKPKRRAIAAIYAFAREVDDIADERSSPTRISGGSSRS